MTTFAYLSYHLPSSFSFCNLIPVLFRRLNLHIPRTPFGHELYDETPSLDLLAYKVFHAPISRGFSLNGMRYFGESKNRFEMSRGNVLKRNSKNPNFFQVTKGLKVFQPTCMKYCSCTDQLIAIMKLSDI